uniref:Bromo domain-containing protein n=1 Tax=Strongyloides stercoralis TaxID=6248 RepID=A0A0K0DW16_STRER
MVQEKEIEELSQGSSEASIEDLASPSENDNSDKDVNEKVCRCSCGKTIIGNNYNTTEPTKDLQPIKPSINFNPKQWISYKERAVIQRALQTITSWVIRTTNNSTIKKKYSWILSTNYLSEENFVNLYRDGEILRKLAISLTPKYKYDATNVDQVIIDCMDLVTYNCLKFREYCVEVFGIKREELFSLEDFNTKKCPKGYRNIFHTLCCVALKCDELQLGTEFINGYLFTNMKSSILERREIGFDIYTCLNNIKHHVNKRSTVNAA